jgi:hypothetical protein
MIRTKFCVKVATIELPQNFLLQICSHYDSKIKAQNNLM